MVKKTKQHSKSSDSEPSQALIKSFHSQAIKSTVNKFYKSGLKGGKERAVTGGKSSEDFVQDAYAAEIESGSSMNVQDVETKKSLFNRIINGYRESAKNKENKVMVGEGSLSSDGTMTINELEVPNTDEENMEEDKINEMRIHLINKFIFSLSFKYKRLIVLIKNASAFEMIKALTPHYEILLKYLMKWGYLDNEYSLTDRAYKLRHTQVRPSYFKKKLPKTCHKLFKKIYHILINDIYARNHYLMLKLKIDSRAAKSMFNNLHQKFEKFLIYEVNEGELSNLEESDIIEILGGDISHSIKNSYDKKNRDKEKEGPIGLA